MIMFYKVAEDGYIKAIGTGSKGEEINEDEYNEIREIIQNRPTASAGYGYRLKESLKWEMYELPKEEEPAMSELEEKAAAYDILMGVSG